MALRQIELRAAEGGADARVFTAELATAYIRHADRVGWKYSCTPLPDLKAGNSLLTLVMEGKGVACLESESGGHRVQRIPHNERRGRVHSSTVTVAVLTPGQQAPDAFRQREPSDFQVSFFSGTGPGGQNRNKVQASARITHLPTGLVRTAQTRSRENSVRLAMEALMLDLDQGGERSLEQDRREQRRDQMGSGERGDKRRTYRFQDDQVQDHQTGKRARASKVMAGHFEALWAVTGTQAA